MAVGFSIHHFHIDHNAPCLPPKFYITIVLDFYWNGLNTQEKLETMVMQNLGGVNKVHYGLCENLEDKATFTRHKTNFDLLKNWTGHFQYFRPVHTELSNPS